MLWTGAHISSRWVSLVSVQRIIFIARYCDIASLQLLTIHNSIQVESKMSWRQSVLPPFIYTLRFCCGPLQIYSPFPPLLPNLSLTQSHQLPLSPLSPPSSSLGGRPGVSGFPGVGRPPVGMGTEGPPVGAGVPGMGRPPVGVGGVGLPGRGVNSGSS